MPSDKASTAVTAFDSSALASLSGEEWFRAVEESFAFLRSSVNTMSNWKDPSALKTRRELEEVQSTIQTITDGLRYFYEEPFEQSRPFFKFTRLSQDELREGDIPNGHKVLLAQFVDVLRTASIAHSDLRDSTASGVTSTYSRANHDDLIRMHQRATYAATAGLLDEATLNRMKGGTNHPETSHLSIKQNLVRLKIGSEVVRHALRVGGDFLGSLKVMEAQPRDGVGKGRGGGESEKGGEEANSPVSSMSSSITNWARTSWDHIIAAGSRTGSPAAFHTASRAVSPEATRRK